MPPPLWCVEDRVAPFVEVFRRTAAAQGYALNFIRPGDEPPAFTAFRQRYRHLSPNTPGFELACFRRWFEIAARVRPDDRFIQADSDLVLQRPWHELPAFVRDAPGVAGSIGVSDAGVPEQQVSPGFSLWTGRLVADFCDYLLAAYEDGGDALAAVQASLAGTAGGASGISDMVMLHRWLAAGGHPFTDTNRVEGSCYIDHNVIMPACANARFRLAFGSKAMTLRGGKAWLRTEAGEAVLPAVIHLVGRSKKLAPALGAASSTGLLATAIYLWGARSGRALLRRVGA